jgi:Cysteine rich repeat
MTPLRAAIVLGIACAVVCAGSARAADKTTPTCHAEVQKFCPSVQAGEGRLLDCLQQHSAELSEACRAQVNTIATYRKCLDDVLRLCPKTEPGGGRGIMCLRSHMSDLSSGCKDELRRIRR